MKAKEAKARIKINKLLEAAGWRFFDSDEGPADIQVEANVKITKKQFDNFGEDFEKVKNGFIDFQGIPRIPPNIKFFFSKPYFIFIFLISLFIFCDIELNEFRKLFSISVELIKIGNTFNAIK